MQRLPRTGAEEKLRANPGVVLLGTGDSADTLRQALALLTFRVSPKQPLWDLPEPASAFAWVKAQGAWPVVLSEGNLALTDAHGAFKIEASVNLVGQLETIFWEVAEQVEKLYFLGLQPESNLPTQVLKADRVQAEYIWADSLWDGVFDTQAWVHSLLQRYTKLALNLDVRVMAQAHQDCTNPLGLLPHQLVPILKDFVQSPRLQGFHCFGWSHSSVNLAATLCFYVIATRLIQT